MNQSIDPKIYVVIAINSRPIVSQPEVYYFYLYACVIVWGYYAEIDCCIAEIDCWCFLFHSSFMVAGGNLSRDVPINGFRYRSSISYNVFFARLT